MARIYLIIGLLSLGAFGYAQYRGVGLFDGPAPTRLTPGATGGGAYGGARTGGWRSGGVGSHPIFHK